MHRPYDFDLAATCRGIAEEVDRLREPLEVRALCRPDGLGVLRLTLGDRLTVAEPTADGRVEVRISGQTAYSIAGELAGLVEWLEITGPADVRDHLATIGRSLVTRYA